ncbi:hypothetical protein K469DRAFT_569532 [Zopfia rhizophila CBS 207.26]|uniref:Cupredoxin n=1 Tax=Zopfia rhizophila CBS 207.26 TaxID=1314779 RepID=A0A6A6E8P9_9PEZI|nr:hypothetical protein K469DRAFT_569532 [Zopfia rhizophila CBS 207.26]
MHALSRGSAILAFIAYLIAPIVAQGSATRTATASGSTPTHTIKVGSGDHKFRPEVTQAEVGDIIEFNFFPPNHSVVRAEYTYPCIPYDVTGKGKVGFYSGFYPVDAILSEPPKWKVKINDTNPIFFYCSAKGSCIDWGMVGVINPNASTSLETHRQFAQNSSYMLQPGESFPSEGSPVGPSGLPTISSSAPSSTSTSPYASTSAAASASSHRPALAAGAIAGIAVAGVTILALAAALFFFIGRSTTLKQQVDRTSAAIPPQSPNIMYQHDSFLAPKSDAPTNEGSRNSAAVPYDSTIYDNYGCTVPIEDPKMEYAPMNQKEHRYSTNRSPTSDRGYNRNGKMK